MADSTGTTKELDCALLKAQAKFPVIEKSKDNPFYKSKYAPYEEIYKGIKPALVENGLLIMHDPIIEFSDLEANVTYRGEGDTVGVTQIVSSAKVTVITSVRHVESGQVRSVEFTAYPDKSNMHGVQAAVTYIKRNNIILLLDIAVGDEDDDGNGGVAEPSDRRPATARRPPERATKQGFTTGAGKPVTMQQATSGLKPEDLEPHPGDLPFDDTPPQTGPEVPVQSAPVDPARPMTDTERKRVGLIGSKEIDTMMGAIKAKGITKAPWLSFLFAEYGYKTIAEVKAGEEYNSIMYIIEKEPQKIMNPEV